MALGGKNTFSLWAQKIANLAGATISKTAIWKRMNPQLVACLRIILGSTFNIHFRQQYLSSYKDSCLFSPFAEVYLQDSTVISLPDPLAPYYKGSVSKGEQKSSIRVQTIYGLFNEAFKKFSLGSFTDNDQSAAGQILQELKMGDLVIRDLGYFVLGVFKKIADMGAYFLSRYKYGTNLYDPITNKKIELLDLFKRKTIVDIYVLAGAKEKVPCRLIAIKLPENVAEERRRKAKNDRDKRLNHSKEYMEVLGWAIFLTNVEREKWTCPQVAEAYRVRWHIEIIFKAWKSHFNLAGLVPPEPDKNKQSQRDILRYKTRVEAIIFTMLIFIVLFHAHLFTYFFTPVYQNHCKLLSFLKVSNYVANHIEKIMQMEDWEGLENELAYYASYEKRKKRLNYFELFIDFDN
jgi:hypothetical protein